MARGRFVSRRICADRALAKLSDGAALAYTWTITHLDRDGLVTGEADLLLSLVGPRRSHWSVASMAGFVEQWIELELVHRVYAADGDAVLFFPGFRKHQVGMKYEREAVSEYGISPDQLRHFAGLHPPEDQQQDQQQDQQEGQDQQQHKAAVDVAVVAALSDLGVIEPMLSRLAGQVTVEMVEAWAEYIDAHNARNPARTVGVGLAIWGLVAGEFPPGASEDVSTFFDWQVIR